MLGDLDVRLGQFYRKNTHIKRFYSALSNPAQAQTAKLMDIVKRNVGSEFGRLHGFDKINSVEDFQSRVPVATYESYKPYVDKLRHGGTNQLTSEQPFMFATTSGTTSDPKYIPITETHLRDYTHAFQVHNYHMIESFPIVASGKFLIITSNDEEGRTPSGMPYGAVSGLLNKRQSPIIRHHFAIPYEMCKVKDVDTKYYLMLRTALAQGVTAILACNPSSLLLLADQMREHSHELIKDIADGTIVERYAATAASIPSFGDLKPQPERARLLSKLLEKEGKLTPKMVWPDLGVLSCWKGGPMAFYLERLPEFYGETPVRDFGYMASEGRGTVPLRDEGAGGVVAVTSHFFEFVEESDMESSRPKFLTTDELKRGIRYYIFFTTNAGLYRYNINDLVEVTDFVSNTPVIKFVRKGLGISSITGEKLTEEQVLVALTHAVNHLNLGVLSHFTTEVELGYPPYYVCYTELSPDKDGLPDSLKEAFIRTFDESLRTQNPEYDDKRSTKRLAEPILRILPCGTYTRLRQQRVAEGAPEAQVKIPLLAAQNSFSGRLALLGG